MKLATFNVNSVRARLPNVLAWLEEARPDCVFLQEIKVQTEDFPRLEFESLGYHLAVHGQKSYNGVAVLSRFPLVKLADSLLEGDPLARYLECVAGGVRLLNIYAPNGNPVESEKFPYKLRWFQALRHRIESLLREEVPFVVGGDFNIIPAPEDCHDPVAWEGDALYRPEVRALWRGLLNLGLVDAFRALHPLEKEAFTFWDYQAGAWQKNNGLRIDHFLLSPQMADRLCACTIDKAVRGQDKASDHTPVCVTFADDGSAEFPSP